MFNIAVIGAGAIGCRIAAHLAQRGISVTLVDGWQAHVDALNRDGLVLERHGQQQTFPAQAYSYASPPQNKFNLVLLAVRSDDTQAALPLVESLLEDDGFVVSCQNGLNEEDIAASVGEQRTLGCSLILGARLSAPGHVMAIEGADTLRIGEYRGPATPRVQAVVDLLSACGTATATDNLMGYRWMKLVLNSTGNTLLLLSGLTGGALHDDKNHRRLIIRMAREILAAAVADGVEPEPVLGVATRIWLADDAVDSVLVHGALAAHGKVLGPRRLSMVADFEARGRTEIKEINGKAVAKARQHGLAAPLNEAAVAMVLEMEAGQRKAGLNALDQLSQLAAPATHS